MPVEGYKAVSLPAHIVERIENVRKREGLRSWREAVEFLIEKSEPDYALIGFTTRDFKEGSLISAEFSV